jgi:uncharacterized protein YrrD
LNPKEKELVALLISNKKIIREESILPLKDVTGISFEAITVDSPAVLRKKNDYPQLKEFVKSPPDIVGLSILKKDGTFLGRAASFSIDTETGKITKIDLAAGFFDSIRKDNAFIPAKKIESIGNEMILAADDAAIESNGRPRKEKSDPTEKRKHGFSEKKTKQESFDAGCGEKIMSLSDRDFLRHRPKIIFPEIERDRDTEKTTDK